MKGGEITLNRHTSTFVVSFLSRRYEVMLQKASQNSTELKEVMKFENDIKQIDDIRQKEGVIVNGKVYITN